LIVGDYEAARVVHQDVESSKVDARRFEKAVERVGTPHIAHRRVDGDRPGTQLGLGLAQRRLTTGTDGDACSLFGQAERNLSADAPARPGHHCYLSS
jgi:hypothetical protein